MAIDAQLKSEAVKILDRFEMQQELADQTVPAPFKLSPYYVDANELIEDTKIFLNEVISHG